LGGVRPSKSHAAQIRCGKCAGRLVSAFVRPRSFGPAAPKHAQASNVKTTIPGFIPLAYHSPRKKARV
jgi:hypothetical protein